MNQTLALLSYVVRDYDEAILFFSKLRVSATLWLFIKNE